MPNKSQISSDCILGVPTGTLYGSFFTKVLSGFNANC